MDCVAAGTEVASVRQVRSVRDATACPLAVGRTVIAPAGAGTDRRASTRLMRRRATRVPDPGRHLEILSADLRDQRLLTAGRLDAKAVGARPALNASPPSAPAANSASIRQQQACTPAKTASDRRRRNSRCSTTRPNRQRAGWCTWRVCAAVLTPPLPAAARGREAADWYPAGVHRACVRSTAPPSMDDS